jgi:hypothetical protein
MTLPRYLCCCDLFVGRDLGAVSCILASTAFYILLRTFGQKLKSGSDRGCENESATEKNVADSFQNNVWQPEAGGCLTKVARKL